MMNAPFLFNLPILPENFKFPKAYLELAENADLLNLDPWTFLFCDMPRSLNYYGAMLQKYKDKPLIPFAIVDDKSGIFNGGYVVLACFDGSDCGGEPKVFFHDYSSNKKVDWASRYQLSNFSEWLVLAQNDSNRFKAEQEED